MNTHDVAHPPYYMQHPSGIECISIVEHFNFNLGNAIKYIWRAGLKTEDRSKDLKKALWYLDREIVRLDRAKSQNDTFIAYAPMDKNHCRDSTSRHQVE